MRSSLFAHPAANGDRLACIAHHESTAAADLIDLTPLVSTFDLDVTRHAVVQKPSNKCRHINHLHRLATIRGERCGLIEKRGYSGLRPWRGGA